MYTQPNVTLQGLRAKPVTKLMREKYEGRRRTDVTSSIRFDTLLRYYYKGMTNEDISLITGVSVSRIGRMYREFYEPIFELSRTALHRKKREETLARMLKVVAGKFFALPEVVPLVIELRRRGFTLEAIPYDVGRARELGVLHHCILVNGRRCSLSYTTIARTQHAVRMRHEAGAELPKTFIRFSVNPKAVQVAKTLIAYTLIPGMRMRVFVIPSRVFEGVPGWHSRSRFEFVVPQGKQTTKGGRKPLCPWLQYENAFHHLAR